MRSVFHHSDFRMGVRQCFFRESPPPVIPIWLAASILRGISRRAQERSPPRCQRQPVLSCLTSCHGSSLVLFAARQAAAAAQPLQPIADAATDPFLGKLRLCLPKPAGPTPVRCPILCAAPSSKEQLARKSA